VFDKNVPVGVRRFLDGHAVRTFVEMKWPPQLENGELLNAAEAAAFEVLVTCDQNIKYQQNLTSRTLALVVLGSNIWPIVRGYQPEIKDYVSYCTLCCLCRGDGGLLGRSASLAFENRVLVQRLVETSPDVVVAVLLQQPLSSPSIYCSERHIMPHAHLFRRE